MWRFSQLLNNRRSAIGPLHESLVEMALARSLAPAIQPTFLCKSLIQRSLASCPDLQCSQPFSKKHSASFVSHWFMRLCLDLCEWLPLWNHWFRCLLPDPRIFSDITKHIITVLQVELLTRSRIQRCIARSLPLDLLQVLDSDISNQIFNFGDPAKLLVMIVLSAGRGKKVSSTLGVL